MRIILLVLLLLPVCLKGQFNISGKITNAEGQPLYLASVFLMGTDYGVATDKEGKYLISDVEEGEYLLKVTYVGYQSVSASVVVFSDVIQDMELTESIYDLGSVSISANRAEETSGFTFENIDMEQLDKQNLGQDLPILLSNAVGVVANSDAGAGIGYTDMRIRGSDGTRVNVTINGVPWNDSESHGVFFVNLPDLAQDASSIQIQRGVGTSTNGAGAFGGTVSLETHDFSINPYARANMSYGSFDTKKIGVQLGSGLINDKFTIDARYSLIDSDGFVDRGASELKSYSFSLARYTEGRSLRFDVFSGEERTYQSWYGVPESKFEGNSTALEAHYNRNVGSLYNTVEDSINLFTSDERYNYYLYQDQVDDYGQNHFQFHWLETVSDKFLINTTLFYTKGSGFFEEYKFQENLSDYQLANITSMEGDTLDVGNVVRRRWLDNHFFGALVNTQYTISPRSELTIGGSANMYLGDHFGEAIGVEGANRFLPQRYYFGEGDKTDINLYAKLNQQLTGKLSVFIDGQIRNINYVVDGTDNDGQLFDIDESYTFFNPKVGLNYAHSDEGNIYLSYARANREPVRSDFTDNATGVLPKPESMDNVELGWRYKTSNWSASANLYHMQYTDQLIPTGSLNDVGALLRQNVDNSYRQGIELSADYRLNDQLSLGGNIALSNNKIESFTEVIYDYTDGFDVVTNTYENTDIALSPNTVANAYLSYELIDDLTFSYFLNHVGKQYLDNTSNDDRAIDGFFRSDLQAIYDIADFGVNKIRLNLRVNNVLDKLYATKGYTYSYIFGDLITENYYYPQAGTYFMLGLDVDF